jgi:hypothetical protein
MWEGTAFPLEFGGIQRPMSNLYHNKLVIAIDWEAYYYLPLFPSPSLSFQPSSSKPGTLDESDGNNPQFSSSISMTSQSLLPVYLCPPRGMKFLFFALIVVLFTSICYRESLA